MEIDCDCTYDDDLCWAASPCSPSSHGPPSRPPRRHHMARLPPHHTRPPSTSPTPSSSSSTSPKTTSYLSCFRPPSPPSTPRTAWASPTPAPLYQDHGDVELWSPFLPWSAVPDLSGRLRQDEAAGFLALAVRNDSSKLRIQQIEGQRVEVGALPPRSRWPGVLILQPGDRPQPAGVPDFQFLAGHVVMQGQRLKTAHMKHDSDDLASFKPSDRRTEHDAIWAIT